VSREAVHRLGILRRPRAQISNRRGADRPGAARGAVGARAGQRQLTRSQDVRQATRAIRPLGGRLQAAGDRRHRPCERRRRPRRPTGTVDCARADGRHAHFRRRRGLAAARPAAAVVVRVRAETARPGQTRSGKVGRFEFGGAGKTSADGEEIYAHQRCSAGMRSTSITIVFLSSLSSLLEEASTRKSAKTHVSNFCDSWLHLRPSDPKINGLPGLIVEHFRV